VALHEKFSKSERRFYRYLSSCSHSTIVGCHTCSDDCFSRIIFLYTLLSRFGRRVRLNDAIFRPVFSHLNFNQTLCGHVMVNCKSASKRHVGSVCFQEMFEDPSLLSFCPQISCNARTVILSFQTL